MMASRFIRPFAAWARFAVSVVLGMLTVGCGEPAIQYILSAALGELHILTRSVPLEDALNDPDRPDEEKEKLRWVWEVRDYAEKQLGLNVSQTYLFFYDTGDGPAVYNLSAARKDALEPRAWTFPFAGTFEYLGYFDYDMALDYMEWLKGRGYDVVLYGASAYSTGGIFRDPLYSSLLRLDKPSLTETIIHELTHNTIFKSDNSAFNESVAEFVGRIGARQYIQTVAGEDSDLYRQALDESHDSALVNHFLAGVYDELSDFYRREDLTSEEKIIHRESIFQAARDRFQSDCLPNLRLPDQFKKWGDLPTNNAWILLNRRYNRDTAVFEKILQACGQDLRAAIQVFQRAVDAPDPFQFLADWVVR